MGSLDILIATKYRLGRKLGGGSFGEIYLGTNLQTGEEVGIKLVSGWARPDALGAWAKPTHGAFPCLTGVHQGPAPTAVVRVKALQNPTGWR